MNYPVVKGVGYALIHTPDMIIHNEHTNYRKDYKS